MKKITKIVLIIGLFFMLIAIRAFVQPYFYDPLIAYFESDYLHMTMPEIKLGAYFLNIFLRYFLNASISLAILFLLFNSKKDFIFSMKFYVLAFSTLSLVLFICLKFAIFHSYLPVFYLRRFLIHPIFLLILIPAFYYQNLKRNYNL